MPIRCFLIEPISDGSRRGVDHWVRPDTGEEREFPHQFGPGAMWYATWFPNHEWENESVPMNLCVETPGGTWNIDSRCSNCTMKEDRIHRCWVRHGDPPNVTVDKSGLTCAAGAGSIMIGNYHGFLRAGELTD